MGLESFGKKAKNAIRAAVLGAGTVASAGAAESALDMNKAEAQIYQESRGNNNANIIGSGNRVNTGSGVEIVTPGGNVVRMDRPGTINISPDTGGSIHQNATGDNNVNIIDRRFYRGQ